MVHPTSKILRDDRNKLYDYALSWARHKYLSPENNAIVQKSAAAAAMAFAPQIAGNLAYESGLRFPTSRAIAGRIIRPFMRDKIRRYTTRPYRKYRNSRRRYSRNFSHFQNSMPYRRGYKRRYGGRRRRRTFGGRRRMRGRYNKARTRFYKRRNYQRGMLRGLQGPNCVPQRTFCRLQHKVYRHIERDPTDSIRADLIPLVSSDLSIGTNGILSFIGTDGTQPAIFPVLLDFFDQVRCYKVTWNLRFIPASSPTGTSDQHGYVHRMVPFDPNSAATSGPQTTDFIRDAMIGRPAVHFIPRWYANVLAPVTSMIQIPRTIRFKGSMTTFKAVDTISNAKDYFNNEEHANLITGAVGSRTIATPSTPTDATMSWQVWNADDQVWSSGEVWSGTLMGTITHHTFWTKANPEFRFDDTPL